MATLRDIRDRIGTVKNTRKITKAMKLVAGAKLNKATKAALEAQPYQQTLNRTLRRVVSAVGEEFEHPLLTQPVNDTVVYVVAISADRGLCGNFNSSVSKSTLIHIRQLQEQGKNVSVICYGKKTREFLKARPNIEVVESHIDLDPADYPDLADALATRLVEDLLADKFSQCFLSFNEYESVMVQNSKFEQILPMQIDDDATEEDAGGAVEYLYEPDGDEILGKLLPMALRGRILQAFLETQAGEQAARMAAMDNATRNASDLIDSLTLVYNRARQAAITTELTEIVSGAEAL